MRRSSLVLSSVLSIERRRIQSVSHYVPRRAYERQTEQATEREKEREREIRRLLVHSVVHRLIKYAPQRRACRRIGVNDAGSGPPIFDPQGNVRDPSNSYTITRITHYFRQCN